MQIIYGYSNCTDKKYREIVSKNNVAVLMPDQKYHGLLIKGFSKNDVVDVKEEMRVYVSPGYTSEIIYFFSGRIKEKSVRKELKLDENEFISDTGFFFFF